MRLGMGLGLGNLLSGQPITGLANKYSFNFDGSNDNLVLDNQSGKLLLNNGASGSISVWVYAETLNQTNHDGNDWRYPTIISKSNVHLSLIVDKDGAVLGFYNDGSAVYNIKTADSIVTTGSWHHIAWTWNASTSKLYVNGTERYSGSYTPYNMAGNNTDVYIGQNASSNSGNYAKWDGLIDEIAVWRDAELSSDDIAKIASKPVDFSKASTYATDRTSNLKLWLRAGDKVLPENDTAIARQDFYTDFDGTDDYVDVGNSADVNFGTSNFSISTWINTSDANGAIYSAYDASHPYAHLRLSSGKVYLYLSNSSANGEEFWASTATVNDGSWHYIAVSVNKSSGVSMYIDGALETLSATGTIGNVANDLGSSKTYNIGRHPSGATYLAGKISNLSLYQTALDAQTISQMAKSRFTPVRDNRFSVVDFDGVNDFIDLPATYGSENISISTWVNYVDDGATGDIFDTRDAVSDGYVLQVNSSNQVAFKVGGVTNTYTGATFANQWIHIVGTYNGTQIKIYINGELVNTSNLASTVSTTTNATIGRRNYNSAEPFQGSISSVAVYNVEKSAEEIYAIYQQGITYDESSLSGLQGYWRMGDDTSKAYPTIADSSSNSNDGTIKNGASDDIVQQMVAGYDLGAFESSEEVGENIVKDTLTLDNITTFSGNQEEILADGTIKISRPSSGGNQYGARFNFTTADSAILKKAPISGELYKFSFNGYYEGGSQPNWFIFSQTSGTITIYPTTTPIDYEFYFISAGAVGRFQTNTPSASQSCYVKNIKFERVLQSEVSDTYPSIIDVNEPVLGVELITNGDFELDSNWADYNTPTVNERSTEQANGGTYSRKFTADAISDGIQGDTFSVTAGKTYKVSVDVYPDDNTQIRVVSRKGDGSHADADNSYTSLTQDAWNTLEFTYVAQLTGSGAYIVILSKLNSGTYYIDNVTVKEIQGNVGTMTQMDGVSNLVYSSVLPDQSFLTGVNSAYNFLDFDGTDAKVTLSNRESLTGNFTISGWLNRENLNTKIFLSDSTSGSTLNYVWIESSGDLSIDFQGLTHIVFSNSNPPHSEWFHFAITRNAKIFKCYVNGDLTDTVDKTSAGAYDNTWTYNQIGTFSAGQYWYNGYISNLAIHNKELSSSEISAIYTAGRHTNLLDSYSDNLKGYYAFGALDAVTGLLDTDSTIYDRSGNSNHGTTSGTATGDLKSPPNAEPNGYAKGDTNRSTTTP